MTLRERTGCQQTTIRADEELTLETSTFESPYGGQFTLSTQFIKPNYRMRLVAGTARISTLEKQNIDCMTDQLNSLKRSQLKVALVHLLSQTTSREVATS